MEYDEFSNYQEQLPEGKRLGSGPLAETIASFIPGMSLAVDARDIKNSINQNDYTGAALVTGLAALGMIPGVGPLAKAGIKGTKYADRVLSPFEKSFKKIHPDLDLAYHGSKYSKDLKDPMAHRTPNIELADDPRVSAEGYGGELGEFVAYPVPKNSMESYLGEVPIADVPTIAPYARNKSQYKIPKEELAKLNKQTGVEPIIATKDLLERFQRAELDQLDTSAFFRRDK